MCSSCFSLDTLRYALAACKFLLHSNEKSSYNVHIKQEGPVTLARGALIEFLGFGETRNTPSCSCSLYIIPETELATELPLRSGLLFFLPRHFAYFKEDSPCFLVKFGSQTAVCLSWVQGTSSPLGGAGSRNRIWCLAFHAWTSLGHGGTASQLGCVRELTSVFGPRFALKSSS